MAQYEHLPIYRAALKLAIHLETIVRGFSRYTKYTLGRGSGRVRMVSSCARGQWHTDGIGFEFGAQTKNPFAHPTECVEIMKNVARG